MPGIIAIGNNANNVLNGGNLDDWLIGLAGNDILNGFAGPDFLEGGIGRDVLNGGLGGDHMVGGLGNDTYFVDNVLDRVFELPGGGVDLVVSSLLNTNLSARVGTLNVENLTLSAAAGV